jgi:hypothetical protein
MPTAKNKKYKSAIKLSKSSNVTFTAIGMAENGLYTWPATAEFVIDIQYMVNSQPLDFIGATAKKIMGSVGPLYYKGEEEGGLYYMPKNDENVSYIFPWDTSLDVPESTGTAGAADASGAAGTDAASGTQGTAGDEPPVAPDPNKYPLKANAVCAAVSMTIGDYVPKVTGNVSVSDLMSAISIKNYKVAESEADGMFHLYYSQGGLTFDYMLKNKKTANAGGPLFIRKKESGGNNG